MEGFPAGDAPKAPTVTCRMECYTTGEYPTGEYPMGNNMVGGHPTASGLFYRDDANLEGMGGRKSG